MTYVVIFYHQEYADKIFKVFSEKVHDEIDHISYPRKTAKLTDGDEYIFVGGDSSRIDKFLRGMRAKQIDGSTFEQMLLKYHHEEGKKMSDSLEVD